MILHRNRRAKIVATVGPASAVPDMLRALFLAGVDTFRLNFSHGSHEDHAQVVRHIRALEEEMGVPVAILQDLQGPKIRIGVLAQGSLLLESGQRIRFVLPDDGKAGQVSAGQVSAGQVGAGQVGTGPGDIPLPHPEIFAAVSPGDDLLIDDGRVRVTVRAVSRHFIEAEVMAGGPISNRKGVNVPGAVLDISPLTAKDKADLAFGLELGVDWIALSFVQKPSDMLEARALIGERAGLVAKIEKPSALQHIDDIIRLSDAVMVARGDLGVEIPPEDVPGRQKEIIRACRLAVKPVIVATQMLDSMISAPAPTRAEASDVAGAIYDGADAVMLSAESAAGRYPVEAVRMMDRIIEKTEHHSHYRLIVDATEPDAAESPSHAVASAAADVAQAIGAVAIVAYTASGATAARIARKRPPVPILAMTHSALVARKLGLLWGAISLPSPDAGSYDQSVIAAREAVLATGLAQVGEYVVAVAGIPFGASGNTNNLRVIKVGKT